MNPTVIGWVVPLAIFLIGARIVVAGNNRGYVLILFAIVAGVAIGWNNQTNQDYKTVINALSQTGFSVDEQLPSHPPVVFDHGQQQIAFIKSDEPLIYSYKDVQKIEWQTTKNTAWANKSSPEKSYSVVFYLQDGAQFSVTIKNAAETLIQAWRNKLSVPMSF